MRQSFFIFCLFCCAIDIHAQDTTSTAIGFYCADCGCSNDGKVLAQGGKCADCGMRLIQQGKYSAEIGNVSNIATIIYTLDKNGEKNLYLFDIPANKKELVGNGSGGQLSADGTKLLFSRGEGSLFLYDVRKKTTEDLAPKIKMEGLQTPAWMSPYEIIFSAGKFPALSLYRMNLENGKINKVIAAEGMRYGCKVSPDGKKIACRSVTATPDSGRRKGISVYNTETAEEKYITSIGEYPAWSTNSKMIAFHWPDSSDFCIYLVNADGTGLQKIAASKGNDCELPSFAPDGRSIFFQSNRRFGNWELWRMQIDGSGQQLLPVE